MIPVRLQPIGPADLDRIAALHAKCFPGESWDRQALGEVMAMPGAGAWQAVSAARGRIGETMGFVFDTAIAGQGEILTIGIAPLARRQGIARVLLENLFERHRKMKVAAITLEVAQDNIAAQRLYESEGFQIAGRRPAYYRRSGGASVDAWILRRMLVEERS